MSPKDLQTDQRRGDRCKSIHKLDWEFAISGKYHARLGILCRDCKLIHGIAREAALTSRKRPSIRPFSPQLIRPAAKGGINPDSIENVGQGALVPVQMCPLVPVCATNRD
jgi:hypothetical protein